MHIASLVYESTHTAPMTPTALRLLVERARIRNKRMGVTGALAYDGTRFMQSLEGPEAAVDAIYASIVLDTRHKDVTQLFKRSVPEREFADWQMGFVSPFDSDAPQALRALGLAGADAPGDSARRLLSAFIAAAPRHHGRPAA